MSCREFEGGSPASPPAEPDPLALKPWEERLARGVGILIGALLLATLIVWLNGDKLIGRFPRMPVLPPLAILVMTPVAFLFGFTGFFVLVFLVMIPVTRSRWRRASRSGLRLGLGFGLSFAVLFLASQLAPMIGHQETIYLAALGLALVTALECELFDSE